MSKQVLTDDVKRFIVTCVAWQMTPSAVVAAVKERFKKTIAKQNVEVYDPTKVAGRSLSAELRELFDAERKTYLEDCSKVALAHRPVRLRELAKLYERAVERGDDNSAAGLLEQIAKEEGGAFTNKRTVDVHARSALADLLGVEPDLLPGGPDAQP